MLSAIDTKTHLAQGEFYHVVIDTSELFLIGH